MLNAAALTYVAAAVSMLLTLLYFLVRSGLLGGRGSTGWAGARGSMLLESRVARYTWLVTSHPRHGVTVRRYASNAEADQHDLDYWKQVPAADRVRLVWTLSVEQWQLAGRLPDEPGLCRSVARVHRR